MAVVVVQELTEAEVVVKQQEKQVEVNNMYSNNAKYEWLMPISIIGTIIGSILLALYYR